MNTGAFSVVLAPKGLELLKLVPDSISGESIGDKLTEVIKSGVIEAGKKTVSSLVSLALTEGYKHFVRG